MADAVDKAAAISKTLGTVLVTAGQINQIAASALGLFGIYRQARDAWKAANPETPDPFLTDLELIEALDGSADKVIATADRLLAKYREPAAPES